MRICCSFIWRLSSRRHNNIWAYLYSQISEENVMYLLFVQMGSGKGNSIQRHLTFSSPWQTLTVCSSALVDETMWWVCAECSPISTVIAYMRQSPYLIWQFLYKAIDSITATFHSRQLRPSLHYIIRDYLPDAIVVFLIKMCTYPNSSELLAVISSQPLSIL